MLGIPQLTLMQLMELIALKYDILYGWLHYVPFPEERLQSQLVINHR